MPYPSHWKQFCEWNKNNKIPAYISLPEINRFAARYRLASGFRGLNVEGFYQESTVSAYSATFKAFLAYTALEQLHKATDSNQQSFLERFGKAQPAFALKLRETPSILIFLSKQLESKKLRDKLQNFIDEKHDVWLCVATGLRHAFSHGFMSVHANNTTPQKTIEFCEAISAELLHLSDCEFSKITDSLCKENRQ